MIDLPTSPAPRAIAWVPVDFGGMQKSALGGSTQRINRLGNRWALGVTMPVLEADEAERWAADLTRGLREGVRLTLVQPDMPTGSPGTVLVNGAAQSGTSLICDGFNPGYVLRKGQFFSLLSGGRRYVHKIATAQRVGASGEATLDIEPPLRVEPADDDTVELGLPQIEGLLSAPQGWNYEPDRLARGFDFTIEEAR
ncbi:hypothetical protein K3172_12905 [Qipengyuania sp. 6B39]|uniref:hypothetical protein n=1 Tax=Qipengyuania proteolytica TaxID=2867239 RepID=UPI001C8AA448|nr:hypothetical protein [Qipengyuania proteolytica]MBX7496758.1 hypothetical protein [Qipengyuania proteolytica]